MKSFIFPVAAMTMILFLWSASLFYTQDVCAELIENIEEASGQVYTIVKEDKADDDNSYTDNKDTYVLEAVDNADKRWRKSVPVFSLFMNGDIIDEVSEKLVRCRIFAEVDDYEMFLAECGGIVNSLEKIMDLCSISATGIL